MAKSYAQLAVEWYKHLFAFRDHIEPERYYHIDYRDLVKNPREAIGKVYTHFGWSLTSAFDTRLKEATRNQGEFRSKHEYSLEDSVCRRNGFKPNWVRSWMPMDWSDN